MDKKAEITKNICEACCHFCPSQIYNNLGYCRLHNGKKGKHLFPAVGEACKEFSPR